ncbi:hypothetical protein [Allosphingosinicella deserti]|uniref:Uncharacterized protein n=1 Tax=Allosphingosinicella deserti TaxID=2116704 RepID=A0A2P7QE87_9SPHN|nr:hypothetical protein [Sphingomonas deserti]PSJ36280.1 hypothetical protein C7I55_26665 [Sphingomonas deserti]
MMKALEKGSEVTAMLGAWKRAFATGAEVIGTMGGQKVFWHEAFGIWGMFGTTGGKENIVRPWNAFGQKPHDFRGNIIVEINMPPRGIDQNLQAMFAQDSAGRRWLLHQGRMSVAGARVTEADFIAATGLKPTKVTFSDGTSGAYHKIANLSASAIIIQEQIAAFIAHCSRARLVKLAKGEAVADLTQVEAWERGLSPELVGTFAFAPRAGGTGRRVHGEIWRALAAELKRRKTPHSNDRVSQYGPDLYTYARGPKVLFEIKSGCGANDIFEAVGQLHIYDRLLGGGYRKVLVVPEGMGKALHGPLASLAIATVEFQRSSGKIILAQKPLDKCLA